MLNWSGFFFPSHWGLSNCLPPSGRFPRVLPPSLPPPTSWVRAVSWYVLHASSPCRGPGHHRGAGSEGGASGSSGAWLDRSCASLLPAPRSPRASFSAPVWTHPSHPGQDRDHSVTPQAPPRLTPSARPGPPRGRHHGPSPRQVALPTQVPTAVLTWSSAIALLSGTPTLGSILRTPGPFQADACEDVCPSGQTPGWAWPWPLALKLTWPFLRLHLLRMALMMCAHPLVMRMKWHHRSQWTLGPGSTTGWVTSQRFYWGLHLSHALKPSHTTPGSWALLSLHIFVIELHGTYLLSRRFWKAGAFAVWVIIFHDIKQCLAPDECQ